MEVENNGISFYNHEMYITQTIMQIIKLLS